MSERVFQRPVHRQVLAVLSALDHSFLAEAKCFFGGGTRIVLELGEYRESRDVDLLCSSRDGYRLLRETVSETSLGRILAGTIPLAREVRSDQYGIRTFADIDGIKLKFEILRESRIDIEGETITTFPAACLTRRHCFAEKFLANTDRGLDASALSRDIVDLAFMIEGWSEADAKTGIAIATTAYGEAVQRSLDAALRKMKEDRAYRNRSIEALGIAETKVLNAGLRALAGLQAR